MKFKVLRGTLLFEKLVNIQTRCDEAVLAADELGEKLGGTHVYSRKRINVAGGIEAIRFSHGNEPDKELWLKPDRHNNPQLFFPRNSAKCKKLNSDVLKQINSLPVVSIKEINDVIEFKDHWVGFSNFITYGLHIHKDYALIEVSEWCNYKPITDMIEIKISEFEELKAKK